MKTIRTIIPAFLLSVFLFPEAASAHLVGGNGLASGLTHPLFGLDHLLAMVAVGIISVRVGGSAVWKVPVAFVSFMVLGGMLSLLGFPLSGAEFGIAMSVLLFGVMIAVSGRLSMTWAFAAVSFFALFHGHAHGTEMPSIANPAWYAVGFVLSTAFLHAGGVLLGLAARRIRLVSGVLRFAGAGMSAAGLFFLLG